MLVSPLKVVCYPARRSQVSEQFSTIPSHFQTNNLFSLAVAVAVAKHSYTIRITLESLTT